MYCEGRLKTEAHGEAQHHYQHRGDGKSHRRAVDFLGREQQIKVYSMLLRKCRSVNLLIPNVPKQNTDATYEGATVVDPIKKFYKVPIATLDFASLYPSIMQAYNLCYSTLIAPPTRAASSETSTT